MLTDRDYTAIVKEENRRHQLQLAEQYGAHIQNRRLEERDKRAADVIEERERI